MKRLGIAAFAAAGVGLFCLPAGAWAQTGAKAHKKAAATAETNRVVRTDLGISYVTPEGYVDNTKRNPVFLTLDGPRTTSTTGLADYRGANYHITVSGYIGTLIQVFRQSNKSEPIPPFPYTAAAAKDLLDKVNTNHMAGDNPLNYQNSTKISVAGQDALAILAEKSVTGLTDRGLVRVVLLRHRGRLYMFLFQAVDVEFETRVPAFENFMGSLKFLEPDVEPTPEAAKPSGPVSISIGK